MNNQNNLKNKSERNSKKLRSFGAICESIHAKLARNPGTRNFVGFAAMVVLICVVWSFAAPETHNVHPSKEIEFVREGGGSMTVFPLSRNNTCRLPQVSETPDSITIDLGNWTAVVPKTAIKEWDGIPGEPIKVNLLPKPEFDNQVTQSRKITFKPTDGTAGVGHSAGTRWKIVTSDETTVTVDLSGNRLVKIPKTALLEYGGIMGERHTNQTTGEIFELPLKISYVRQTIEPQKVVIKPENLPQNLQGGTPELLETLNRTVPNRRMKSLDYLSGNNICYSSAPFFDIYGGWLAEKKAMTTEQKAAFDTSLWKFSLRPEFAKYGITDFDREEDEYSCGVKAMQQALELLWSRKESRPVKLSTAYLRWAHDNVHPGQKIPRGGSSDNIMIQAIHKFGVCEAALMPPGQTTPSAAAIANAAQRKTLVVRTVGAAYRRDPNKGDAPQNTTTFPVMELVARELQKGHPILVSGLAPLPENGKNPILGYESEATRNLKKGRYASKLPDNMPYWEKNLKGFGSHTHLLIGYFAARELGGAKMDTEEAKTIGLQRTGYAYSYVLEFRESWGSNVGDNGHIYYPVSLHFSPKTMGINRFASLALE